MWESFFGFKKTPFSDSPDALARRISSGGEGLPEVPDGDGKAATKIACKGESWGALTRGGKNPGGFRAGALDDSESVRGGLDSLKSSQMAFFWKTGWDEGLAGLLRDAAAAGLERLRPEAAIGAGKTDGAVARLVAHGHVELKAEAADKVFFLIAVEDDGVDEPDELRIGRCKSRVEL